MLEGIKKYIGNSFLRKITSAKRHAVISNYHTAKSVAVVYLANNESQFVLVKQFMKKLQGDYGIRKVRALAMIEDKEVPSYFLRGINQSFICTRDLNWYQKPQGNSYEKFINESHDILIDFSNGDCLPLQFATKESAAGLKVGKAGSDCEEQYDLLIGVNKENTFDEYIRKINVVLDSINHHKSEHELA